MHLDIAEQLEKHHRSLSGAEQCLRVPDLRSALASVAHGMYWNRVKPFCCWEHRVALGWRLNVAGAATVALCSRETEVWRYLG